MKKIAIFASGSGSNAENIIKYFHEKQTGEIALIVCNKPDAYVLERAKKFNIPSLLINRKNFYESDEVVEELKRQNIDFVVLAGFLWLVPENLIKAFPDHIINIHPALLPKYGGKGMYGMNVHKAVYPPSAFLWCRMYTAARTDPPAESPRQRAPRPGGPGFRP